MTLGLILSLTFVLVLLLGSIVFLRIHPVLALVLAALLLGVLAGVPLAQVAEDFLVGFGETLKWIGMIIVLGAAIGEVLGETNASLRIADGILRIVGERRLPVAMTATGYIISIPTFSDVAYIIMRPVTEALAARSGQSLLAVGLSLLAGLLASHALLPPTPGPLAAAGIMGAEIGRVVLVNVPVALFAAVGGLLCALFVGRRVRVPASGSQVNSPAGSEGIDQSLKLRQPGFLSSVFPILLPLALIAAGAFVKTGSTGGVSQLIQALGTPLTALLIGFLAAVILMRQKDFGTSALERGIQRSASVILITGAGGGFGAVIRASGIGAEMASAIEATQLPGLLLPFLLAMTLTTATGSTTVSMVTSASVTAPLLGSLGLSSELAVALIGAGAIGVVHANASLFWLLSRLHDVPPQTLYRSLSLQSLVMSISGFLAVLLLRLCGFH